MRRVVVRAVNLAGHHDADGRLLRKHRPRLHRRGVRPQKDVLTDIEGVLHIPRRMVGGNAEGLEVVVIRFDLRPFLDRKTETDKGIQNFVFDLGDGVRGTDLIPFGEGNVDLFGF